VYVIAYKPAPEAKPDRYAVIYVDHSADLSAERFPFQHPRAHCWIKRAGSKYKVYICTYEIPAALRATGSRSSGNSPRSTGRAATTSSTTRPGRMSGSAVPRRSPLG